MEGYRFSHGVRFLINDREYIVREEKDKDIVIEDISYKQIKTVAVDYLLSEFSSDTLRFRINEDDARKSVHDDIELYSEEELQEINRRFSIIEPFILGKKRPCSVEEYLAQLPQPKPSRSTLYRWLNLYNSHNDKRYLSPRYDQRGPRERRVDPDVNRMLVDILNDDKDGWFYSGTDVTIYSVYTTLANKVKKANEERETKDKLQMISKDTVYRIVHEIQDVYRKDVARRGKVAADLKKHGATAVVLAFRPLERVEVDWTPLDMFIVDTGTFKRERLFLVYAIDKCTSYPLGFHVTFDEPNAVDIKQCLLHAILPKTYVKQYYPEVKHRDAWGVPEEIVVDNAKVFESMDLENVLELCGIDMQFCHVKAAHQKGSIEKGLQDINRIIQQLPGSLFSNPQERSNYDSEGKATVTLIGLYRILHVLIIDRIAHAINHDVGMTRHHMWEQKLKVTQVQRTLPYSKETLKLMFGSLIKARAISNKGVVIERQYYQSDALQELRQRLENKTGEAHPKVRLRYDLADMRAVYVYDPDYERYITARATINSLEKKGIDEQYPVHYQQLADYSLSVSRGIGDFDVTELAEADETMFNIIKDDKALLRGVSRLTPNQIDTAGNVPVISLVSLQLDQSSLNAVGDLDTLGDIRLAGSDAETNRGENDETDPASSAKSVSCSEQTTDNATAVQTAPKKRPRKGGNKSGKTSTVNLDNGRFVADIPDQNQTAVTRRPDQDDEDWEALYVAPQRGI